MIEIAVVLLSMTLQTLTMPRDDVWTPTFKGSRQERFVRAMHYYQEKMGFEDQMVFHLESSHPFYDAYVAPAGFNEVIVGYAQDSGGPRRRAYETKSGRTKWKTQRRVWKPEFLALHEACHIRYYHHLRTVDFPHKEVERCMKDYSKKVRR